MILRPPGSIRTGTLFPLSPVFRSLGVRMVEKLPVGSRRTAAGEEVRGLATQIETSSLQLETLVFGRDQSVRGLLRVTLTPLLATHLLMPDLTDFARLHPDIEMEILSSGELANQIGRESCRERVCQYV